LIVTGVQTCALPIFAPPACPPAARGRGHPRSPAPVRAARAAAGPCRWRPRSSGTSGARAPCVPALPPTARTRTAARCRRRRSRRSRAGGARPSAGARADRRGCCPDSGRRGSSAPPRQLDRWRADQALQRRRELAYAHADLFGGKLPQQRLRDLAGEPLDEVHATLRADLDDPPRHLAVVDGAREVVRDGGAREIHRELGIHREPHADGLLGGGHAVMAVEAHVLEAQAIGRHSFTTGFLREPTPSTRISTRSPGTSRAAPGGVPVEMTSPGMSVITSETRAIRSSTGKIMSLVEPDCRSTPLTSPSTLTAFGSRSVAMHGPMGQNVSKPLARSVRCSRLRTSWAVMSLSAVYPSTYSR